MWTSQTKQTKKGWIWRLAQICIPIKKQVSQDKTGGNRRDSLHELEADAEVVAEVEVLQHVYHIVAAVRILLPQVVQDPHFYQRLVVKSLLIPLKQNIMMTTDLHSYQIPWDTLSKKKSSNLESSL